MSLRVQVQEKIQAHCGELSLDVKEDHLNAASIMVATLGAELFKQRKDECDVLCSTKNLTQQQCNRYFSTPIQQVRYKESVDADYILSQYKDRLTVLFCDRFPFASVSNDVTKVALTQPELHRGYSLRGVLKQIIMEGRFDADEIEAFVDQIDSLELAGAVFGALHASQGGDEKYDYFHALMHVLCKANYPRLYGTSPYCDRIKNRIFNWDYSKFPKPLRIIDILLFKEPYRPSLKNFINMEELIRFTKQNLVSASFAEWPNKGPVLITVMLSEKSSEAQKALAEKMAAQSTDPKTQEVGRCLAAGMTPRPLSEKYALGYRLKELVPKFEHTEIETLFECRFPEFEPTYFSGYNDPVCVRRINGLFQRKYGFYFEHAAGDRVFGSLISTSMDDTNHEFVSVDRKTHRLQWSTPITAHPHHCFMTDLGLIVQYRHTNYYDLFDTNTGAKLVTFNLPDHHQPGVQITKAGFCYFYNFDNDTLCGGQISLAGFQPAFEIASMEGSSQALGEYALFKDPAQKTLQFLSSDGSVHTIANATSAVVRNGFLYITQPLETNRGCKIVRQSLPDSPVFNPGDDATSIDFPDAKLELNTLCDDGTLIGTVDQKRYFIQFEKNSITPVQKDFPSWLLFWTDTKNNCLYSWSPEDNILYKHSQTGSVSCGKLSERHDLKFTHVDGDGRLCFYQRV